MFTQPMVFRLYVPTESDATSIQHQLNSMGIRPDYIKSFSKDEPAKWKVIFAAEDRQTGANALAKLHVKSIHVDVFDPSEQIEGAHTGWSDFKPVV